MKGVTCLSWLQNGHAWDMLFLLWCVRTPPITPALKKGCVCNEKPLWAEWLYLNMVICNHHVSISVHETEWLYLYMALVICTWKKAPNGSTDWILHVHWQYFTDYYFLYRGNCKERYFHTSNANYISEEEQMETSTADQIPPLYETVGNYRAQVL